MNPRLCLLYTGLGGTYGLVCVCARTNLDLGLFSIPMTLNYSERGRILSVWEERWSKSLSKLFKLSINIYIYIYI